MKYSTFLTVPVLLGAFLALGGCGIDSSTTGSDGGPMAMDGGTDGSHEDGSVALDGGDDAGTQKPPLSGELGPIEGEAKFTKTTEGVPMDGVRCDAVEYDSQGFNIKGQVCRPTAGDKFPLLIANHGLGAYKSTHAAAWAKLGFAVFESAYRGEGGSDGLIDYCKGEVYDVRRMIQIAKAQTYVDTSTVGMVGYSHGGCVTMKVLAAEAYAGTTKFDAVVNVFGPADWAATYNHIAKLQDLCLIDSKPCDTLADLRRATGGAPKEEPEAYEERSPLFLTQLLEDVAAPLLILHATGDSIVPYGPNCGLAVAMGEFEAWHIGFDGNAKAGAPPACNLNGLTWSGGTAPTTTYGAERTIVVYDTISPFGHAENLGAGMNMQSRALAFMKNKIGL
ncbi:MAG: prolyl oligopeptidase family serine peptidase [Myxococcales bacterium]|nr:prolyl oligopeptidase family serine peptidase [Myxococcales bacterium]